MDKKLNIVVFMLFSLSAIIVMGSSDKTEMLFHLLVVSILAFFALYVYHKQTIEAFICDSKVVDDELDCFYEKLMTKEEQEEWDGTKVNDFSESLPAQQPFIKNKLHDNLSAFYERLTKSDPLLELTDGERNGKEEIFGDGDFKHFFNKNNEEKKKMAGVLNDKLWKNKRFEGYSPGSKLYSMGAKLGNEIGEYDGVDVNAEKYQYRRIMSPGFDENMIPGKDQKCGSLSAPCKGVMIDKPFQVTPDGGEVSLDFGHDSPDKLNMSVDGHKKPTQYMSMFHSNQCKPGCCPSTYSCSTGCVCTTNKQRNMLSGRGNKSPFNH
jgi:hypothetical protein